MMIRFYSFLLALSLLPASQTSSFASQTELRIEDDGAALRPRLIPASGVDMGVIQAAERKKTTLKVVNSTGFTVKLGGWRSPCSACLEVNNPPWELDGKGLAEVELVLDGSGYRGEFSKSMFVFVSAEGFDQSDTFIPIKFTVVDKDLTVALPPTPPPKGTSTLWTPETGAEASPGKPGVDASAQAGNAKGAGTSGKDAASPLESPTASKSFKGAPSKDLEASKGVQRDANPFGGGFGGGATMSGIQVVDYIPGGEEHKGAEAWIFGGRNCPGCNHLKAVLLPSLFEGLPARVVMAALDRKENLLLLLKLEERLGLDGKNSKTPVLYWRGRLIYGNDAVTAMIEDPSLRPEPVDGGLDQSFLCENVEDSERDLAKRRAEQATMATVLVAGLIDGINPCAISTLVFLMSLLAVSKIGGGRLLLVGATYCVAGFMTYLAIGLGLFNFLRMLEGFSHARSVINLSMGAALVLLSFLSFRDAWRFMRSGSSGDVSLKLPDGVRDRIHGVMKRGLALRYIVPGFFLVGVAVTVLESVCTGQVYLPTLALLAKTEAGSRLRWLLPLVAYNLMFIVPLVAVFLSVYFVGVKTPGLLKLGRRGVVPGKVALGLLFAAMAAMLFWL